MSGQKTRSASVGRADSHRVENLADNDEVFEASPQQTRRNPKATPETPRRQRSFKDVEHRSRSMERHSSRHSSRKSHHSDLELHECTTKTDLIRASAKRAEEKRRSSENNDHYSRSRQKSGSSSSPKCTPKRSPHSAGSNRRPSVAIIEVHRTSRKRDSPSPKRSLSNSPKHRPVSATNSKTSLLEKQNSTAGSPLRNYAGLINAGRAGTETRLFAHSRGSGYSKPAMEVAVAALVFGAGVVTLIVALIIGSTAWMIVGAISMGIGGVFIAFGACFYMSRHKPLMPSEEQVEIRIVDQKQLAELSDEGFKVRAVMDL